MILRILAVLSGVLLAANWPASAARAAESEPARAQTHCPADAGRSAEVQLAARLEADAKDDVILVASNEEPLPLTITERRLRDRIRQTLKYYYPKHQNTRDNNPWEVMHEIIAYGVEAQLFREAPNGRKVNAIGWLCYNGACHGDQLFQLDRGRIVGRLGPGVQGHGGQFLAIVAQSHLTADYPMLIGGKKFTIADLIESEKRDCQAGTELTFKLIGLMHYGRAEDTWHGRDGDIWNIERLISEELKQPIRGAACGGTHRLMGLSYAVNKQAQRGEPITGEFRRAQIFINEYHRYTFGLQNPDGSFSTKWFVQREAKPDVDRRLKTTGHILEWLSFSLSESELRDPRVVRAVNYLVNILSEGQDHTWEIGPLGHALHALSLYDARVFQETPPAESPPLVVIRPKPPSRPTPRPAASAIPVEPKVILLDDDNSQDGPARIEPSESAVETDDSEPVCELAVPPVYETAARPSGSSQPACKLIDEDAPPRDDAAALPGPVEDQPAAADVDDENCL